MPPAFGIEAPGAPAPPGATLGTAPEAAFLAVRHEVHHFAGLLARLHVEPEIHGQQVPVGRQEGVAERAGGTMNARDPSGKTSAGPT
jgi:hypothetical protein